MNFGGQKIDSMGMTKAPMVVVLVGLIGLIRPAAYGLSKPGKNEPGSVTPELSADPQV